MSKKWIAAAIGLVALVGMGSTASAGRPDGTVDPVSQTVDASASFSVTYTGCYFGDEEVVFTFEGVVKAVPCEDTAPGVATASFTAPATPGDYIGEACPRWLQVPAGLQSTPAGSPQFAAFRSSPAMLEGPALDTCVAFVVKVREPETTTTTTTTIAPTTTLAPTTTAAAAVPPAPTTTAAATSPILPATGPSQNDNTATIAILLLIAGGGLIVAARWRSSHTPS